MKSTLLKSIFRPVIFAITTAGLTTASIGHAVEPTMSARDPYEVRYLKMMIDHHYSALRMTELAAGTDLTRDAALSASEGTSPTPDTEPTPAKSQLDDIKSLARRNNRMQREEILMAQNFLKEWYSIDYMPMHMDDMGTEKLELAPAGPEFDKLFLKLLIAHHNMALAPSTKCMVSVELDHDALHRYCSGIVHSQTNDILDMRELLCKEFGVCGPGAKKAASSKNEHL